MGAGAGAGVITLILNKEGGNLLLTWPRGRGTYENFDLSNRFFPPSLPPST